MTSAEVSELTEQIDINALREYRDAVGRRTRDVLGVMDLEGGVPQSMFTGRPRLGVLSGMAVMHSMQHLGEAFTVRSAGGFGVGA